MKRRGARAKSHIVSRIARKRFRRLAIEHFEPRQLLAVAASDDFYVTSEQSPLVIAAPGVLLNDGGAVSAAIAAQPTHGTVVLNANGGFTYTPATRFSGRDSFTYQASDG